MPGYQLNRQFQRQFINNWQTNQADSRIFNSLNRHLVRLLKKSPHQDDFFKTIKYKNDDHYFGQISQAGPVSYIAPSSD